MEDILIRNARDKIAGKSSEVEIGIVVVQIERLYGFG